MPVDGEAATGTRSGIVAKQDGVRAAPTDTSLLAGLSDEPQRQRLAKWLADHPRRFYNRLGEGEEVCCPSSAIGSREVLSTRLSRG